MLRRFLLASAGAAALAGSAVAADLPLRSPPPPYVPPPPVFTWTGLYAGASVGYAWANDHASISDPGILTTVVGDVVVPGVPAVFVPFGLSPSGVIGGGQIGYNLQYNQWVLGLEGDVSGLSLSQTRFAGFDSVRTQSNIQGSVRLRAGFALDRVLLYATGGAGFAGIENTYSSGFGFDSIGRTRTGWTVGGGIEYAVTNNWSIRAEYRYSDFGHYTDFLINSGAGIGANAQHHLTQNQVEVGVNYHFVSAPAAPVVAKY